MGQCGSSRAKAPSGAERKRASGSAESPDVYAVYLRPRRLKRKTEVVAAMEFNRRWGGIHITLCSFAPSSDTGGTKRNPPHGSELESALASIQMAGQVAVSYRPRLFCPRVIRSLWLVRTCARPPHLR